MSSHEHFIVHCLHLAEQGRGYIGNGALVGAALVRTEKIINDSWHKKYGLAHAEANILNTINDQKIQKTDVLYINLEPCCHHGKTPPCTDLIIKKGIKTVIFGMFDPDVRMAGKGIHRLKQAGIDVVGPVLPELCQRENRGYVSVRTQSRPWITLKKATAADSSIAHADGSPMKITSKNQDIWSHTWLRAKHDAILVGIQTVLNDNPQLNKRLDQNKNIDQINPYKIVLDKNLRINLEAKLVNDNDEKRTIIITSQESDNSKKEELMSRGVIVKSVPIENNQFVWSELWSTLITPHDDYHGITSILVEGGKKTWDAFRAARYIDEEVILTS